MHYLCKLLETNLPTVISLTNRQRKTSGRKIFEQHSYFDGCNEKLRKILYVHPGRIKCNSLKLNEIVCTYVEVKMFYVNYGRYQN